MAKSKITSISISGNTVMNKDLATDEGDIYLFRRDDSAGRFARKGGHTNFGYSGYFLASIFDGTIWRKLQINALIPYDQRSYNQASDANAVALNIGKIVLSWKGRFVTYSPTTRSFTTSLDEKN